MSDTTPAHAALNETKQRLHYGDVVRIRSLGDPSFYLRSVFRFNPRGRSYQYARVMDAWTILPSDQDTYTYTSSEMSQGAGVRFKLCYTNEVFSAVQSHMSKHFSETTPELKRTHEDLYRQIDRLKADPVYLNRCERQPVVTCKRYKAFRLFMLPPLIDRSDRFLVTTNKGKLLTYNASRKFKGIKAGAADASSSEGSDAEESKEHGRSSSSEMRFFTFERKVDSLKEIGTLVRRAWLDAEGATDTCIWMPEHHFAMDVSATGEASACPSRLLNFDL